MKHLKPYQLFESEDVLFAGLENAMMNYNIKLFKDIIEQHSDNINYNKLVKRIFENITKYNMFLQYMPVEKVTELDCQNNVNIKELDTFLFPNLELLLCGGCYLDKLDLSKNLRLTEVICDRNSLTELDVSMLYNLEALDCSDNELTRLYVMGAYNLEMLYCEDNMLTTLNLKGLTKLSKLDCTGNKLNYLDVSNQGSFYVFHTDLEKKDILLK